MFDDGICNDDSDSDDDHGDSGDEAAEEVNEDDDVEELEEEESDEVDAGEESAGHSKPTGGTSNAAAGLKNAVLFGLYPQAGSDSEPCPTNSRSSPMLNCRWWLRSTR
jgi:hypothetical protein